MLTTLLIAGTLLLIAATVWIVNSILILMPQRWKANISGAGRVLWNFPAGVWRRLSPILKTFLKVIFTAVALGAIVHIVGISRAEPDEITVLLVIDFVLILAFTLVAHMVTEEKRKIVRGLCLVLMIMASTILISLKGPEFYSTYAISIWVIGLSLLVIMVIGFYNYTKSNKPIWILALMYFGLAFTFLDSPSKSLDVWYETWKLEDEQGGVEGTRNQFPIKRNIEKSQVQIKKDTYVYEYTPNAAQPFSIATNLAGKTVMLKTKDRIDVVDHGKVTKLWGSTTMTQIVLDINNIGANVDTLWMKTNDHTSVLQSILSEKKLVYTAADSIESQTGYVLTFIKPLLQPEYGKKLVWTKSPALLKSYVNLNFSNSEVVMPAGRRSGFIRVFSQSDGSYVVRSRDKSRIGAQVKKLPSGDLQIFVKKI